MDAFPVVLLVGFFLVDCFKHTGRVEMVMRKNDEIRHAEAKNFALSLAQIGLMSGLGIGAVGLASSVLLHGQSSMSMKVAGLISILIFLASLMVLLLMARVHYWIISQEMTNGLLKAEEEAEKEARKTKDAIDDGKFIETFYKGSYFLSDYLQSQADLMASRFVGYGLFAMLVSFLIALFLVVKLAFFG